MATVIQLHVLGMFLPSFFNGSLITRFGVLRISLARVALLAGHIMMTLTLRVVRWSAYPSTLVEDFRDYGPAMNTFDAAEKAGRATDLKKELDGLFESQNTNGTKNTTSIPATYLRVTVNLN